MLGLHAYCIRITQTQLVDVHGPMINHHGHVSSVSQTRTHTNAHAIILTLSFVIALAFD